MTLIDDGIGKGFRARVDSQNRLRVHAVTESDLHAISESGDAYTWSSGTYDPAAGDTILLVKNTSNTPLHIEAISVSTDVDTRVVVHYPTSEVTVAGTTVTGVNLNTGSSNVAEATAARDETGNSQGDIIWSGEVTTAQGAVAIVLQGAAILAKNTSIGVDYVADVAACDVTIMGFFEA